MCHYIINDQKPSIKTKLYSASVTSKSGLIIFAISLILRTTLLNPLMEWLLTTKRFCRKNEQIHLLLYFFKNDIERQNVQAKYYVKDVKRKPHEQRRAELS